MPIQPILPQVTAAASEISAGPAVSNYGQAFSERLDSAMKGVSTQLNAADVRLARVASGEEADLHGTMIALQEADISLRLMVSTRDKAVEAYEKIMSMQI